MIEKCTLERNGEIDIMHQATIVMSGLNDVTISNDKEDILITFSGTEEQLKAFMRRLAKHLEKIST